VQSPCAAAPPVLRKLPAGQSRWALEPAAQYEPAGQLLHDVAWVPSWYWPPGQSMQMLAPADGACVPGLQAVGLEERATHDEPAGQSAHCVPPLVAWYLPAAQAVQTLLPWLAAIVPGPHADG